MRRGGEVIARVVGKEFCGSSVGDPMLQLLLSRP